MPGSNPRITIESDEKKAKRLRRYYRETFKTDNDLVVLYDILNECGWFVNDLAAVPSRPGWNSDIYTARHTLAQFILTRIGAMQEFNGVDILHALKKLPFEKEN